MTQPRWATTQVTDNGKLHYGAGMPGSICGCHNPKRRETVDSLKVDCPECKQSIAKTRLTK